MELIKFLGRPAAPVSAQSGRVFNRGRIGGSRAGSMSWPTLPSVRITTTVRYFSASSKAS
jgi:hypothetical protein